MNDEKDGSDIPSPKTINPPIPAVAVSSVALRYWV